MCPLIIQVGQPRYLVNFIRCLTITKRWNHFYLFPPPLTTLMLQVVNQQRHFSGRVLQIAPLWKSQTWIHTLLQWGSNPLPLQGEILQGLQDRTVTDVLSGHRDSTICQYQSTWKAFQSFLMTEGVIRITAFSPIQFASRLSHTHKSYIHNSHTYGSHCISSTIWLRNIPRPTSFETPLVILFPPETTTET